MEYSMEERIIRMDQMLKSNQLKEFEIICSNCFHSFHPRSLTSKCPQCKNKLSMAQRLEIDKKIVTHNCKKCGHQWTQRNNSIIPPVTCPSCHSSTWQRTWRAETNRSINGTRYPTGPFYKHYAYRIRHPIGKDGAMNIVTNYIQAQYVNLE